MLRIDQRFLTEERGARGRGIPRGSVGATHDTEICGGTPAEPWLRVYGRPVQMAGTRAPIREISPEEREERARFMAQVRPGDRYMSDPAAPPPVAAPSTSALVHRDRLDMRDPRQVRRAKAREERAQQRASESPLNRYARETREIGRTGTV